MSHEFDINFSHAVKVGFVEKKMLTLLVQPEWLFFDQSLLKKKKILVL
jgi:hypothetical protein